MQEFFSSSQMLLNVRNQSSLKDHHYNTILVPSLDSLRGLYFELSFGLFCLVGLVFKELRGGLAF